MAKVFVQDSVSLCCFLTIAFRFHNTKCCLHTLKDLNSSFRDVFFFFNLCLFFFFFEKLGNSTLASLKLFVHVLCDEGGWIVRVCLCKLLILILM